MERIVSTFTAIAMDGPMFRERARVMADKTDDLAPDAMIAITACRHRLIVVTGNVKGFRDFNVQLFNPFSSR